MRRPRPGGEAGSDSPAPIGGQIKGACGNATSLPGRCDAGRASLPHRPHRTRGHPRSTRAMLSRDGRSGYRPRSDMVCSGMPNAAVPIDPGEGDSIRVRADCPALSRPSPGIARGPFVRPGRAFLPSLRGGRRRAPRTGGAVPRQNTGLCSIGRRCPGHYPQGCRRSSAGGRHGQTEPGAIAPPARRNTASGSGFHGSASAKGGCRDRSTPGRHACNFPRSRRPGLERSPPRPHPSGPGRPFGRGARRALLLLLFSYRRTACQRSGCTRRRTAPTAAW